MENTLMNAFTLATAAGSAVLGGALVAFSTVVMPALASLTPRDGLEAMQAINVAAPRGWLMLPLLGSAIGSAVVGGWAMFADRGDGRWLLTAGALAGVAAFAVTAGYHVPRNTALGGVDATSEAAVAAWAAYQPGWTALNSVRAALALASAGLMVAGTVRPS
ncbi:MAG: DUF1772 domain-containing protein [Humibacillus sp.]|nr:DUF1772 domain-containing protein [Humibacillus sp.]MDN5779786.1 DUF1772 domain-containing protein [Humibacillus sp.]